MSSRRPPYSTNTFVAHTEPIHLTRVWASFVLKGAFSVAPCQTQASPLIRNERVTRRRGGTHASPFLSSCERVTRRRGGTHASPSLSSCERRADATHWARPRCRNTIYAEDFGVTAQIVPLLAGFFTYKVSTIIEVRSHCPPRLTSSLLSHSTLQRR
jgi:hypothetical protein